MDTESLKTFITLASLKNFTQTSQRLFVAQSTVTNRILELEKEVGKKLFIRNKKNVALTAEGECFLRYANNILELEENAIKKLNTLSDFKSHLHIGTANTIYECYLSSFVSDMLKDSSNTSLEVTIGQSEELLQKLQDGVIDIAFTYIPLYRPGYTCRLYKSDELILVTSASNNHFSELTKEDLVNIDYLFCNFALREVGYFIRELFPAYHVFPLQLNDSTKILNHLLSGKGYSFLPHSLVEKYIASGELVEIKLKGFETPKINSYMSYMNSFSDKLPVL